MKEVYELFNEIEIDVDEFEKTPVTDLEKVKLKKVLKGRIVKSKKQNKWKKAVTVAVITFGFMSTALVGLSFSSYAEEIPFLGNIFKFFNGDGTFEVYDENADELNLVQESNGIKISLNEAVFDGRSLFLTYTIESEKDLGDKPWLNSLPKYGNSGLGGSDQVTEIEDGKYIGVLETSHYEEELNEINVNWVIDSISTEPNNNGTVFEGYWEFNFNLVAVNNQTIDINESVEKNGITATIDKITLTPMSFLLYHNQTVPEKITNEWDNVFVDVEIKDDLGNLYTLKSQGGTGPNNYLNWITTFEKLDPNATKLILTPIVELSDNETLVYDKNGEPIKASYRLIDSKADFDEFEFDEIIVDLK